MTAWPEPRWWSEGRRELDRWIRLARARRRLWREGRHLERVETDLGTLGWQQAEFFAPEIQQQVDRIMDFEMNQAALLNREALLAEEKTARETARQEAGAIADQAIASIASEGRELAAACRARQATLLEKTRATGTLRQQLRQVQTEIEQLQILQARITTFDTEEAAQESDRVAGRLAELSGHEAELQMAIAGQAERERVDCVELAALEDRISQLEQTIDEHRVALEAEQERIDAEIGRLEDEQRRMREMTDALEHQKISPYRLIGQCLADNDIGSRNQPEALENVRTARRTTADLEEEIAGLRAECARADRRALILFHFVVALAAQAVVLLAIFLLR